MKLRLLLQFACVLAGACLFGQSTSNNSGSSQNKPEEIPEIHGFDMSAMDRGADPCDDFYQYVCGAWMKSNPIPSDQGRWGNLPNAIA